MIKFQLILHHPLKKAACFVLLFLSLLFSLPGHAQKKTSRSKRTSYTNKRVIYGMASFYAGKFHGRRTASGEIFSQNKYTCACNMLPFGTWLKVTNLRNGKTVEVKVNDRLHPRMRRVADLSRIAAKKLGYTSSGLVRVKVEVLGKRK